MPVRFRVIMMLIVLSLHVGMAQSQGAVTGSIAYVPGGDVSQQLDVYLPAGNAPYPTLMLIHGGGFTAGGKEQLGSYAGYFTARGYAVVSINYRLAPGALYPIPVQDSFCALAWIYASAPAYGFDTGRLAVIGESSGGALATFLATADQPASFLRGCPNRLPAGRRLTGVVDYYPLTGASFDSYPAATQSMLYAYLGIPVGQLDLLRAASAGASPLQQVDGNEPPFLLIHGTGDDVVPAHDSVDLHDRLQAAGVRADLVILPDVDHGFISLLDTPESQQAAQAVEAFLHSLGM